MAVGFSNTNKPINPRGNDASPKAFNRAKLFSGKALSFDGVNDILTMPTALTSSLSTTTITHVVNFKTDFTTWSGARYEVFSYNERGVFLSFNNGNIYVYYRHNASGWGNFQIPVGDVKMQEWNHCVIVIDYGNTLGKAYINGQEVVSSVLSQTGLAYDANALTIGGQSTYRFFDGQIAGFKLFNTALTAAQVADLYNNPEKVVPTGVDNTALKLWLPMQEGAGTTAYDGSGNGNHGTISGATWTHGIGAPVSQTAVIDWNKGVNLVQYSEGFTNGYWTKLGASVTANAITAPDGSNTGFSLIEDTSSNAHQIQATGTLSTSVTYNVSVFAKAHSSGRFLQFAGLGLQAANEAPTFDLVNGLVSTGTNTTTLKNASIEDAGNGWYRCSAEVYATGGANFVLVVMNNFNDHAGTDYTGDGTSRVHIWGAQVVQQANLEPYVRTGATAQTSEVLLPQGLTTGRDITGVNLFENVRKQGALNLDGNSWAEVHDNASLDVTTAVTLECWYKWGTRVNAGVLGRWDYTNNQRSILILHGALDNARLLFSFDGTNAAALEGTSTPADGTWVHIAGTYDGTTFRIYINATQEATSSSTGVLYNSPDPLEIGRHGYGAIDELNGPIAQPRIYNRALTAEEVSRNYDAGRTLYQ